MSSQKRAGGREWQSIEYIGLAVLAIALLGLLVAPQKMGGLFDAMFQKALPIVAQVFLTGLVGTAIILSVMTGRILERLGLTDALMRVFVPIVGKMGINSSVVVPGVYNILGDINAAGRIAGPVLKQSGATKDEQKIAIATMVQSQQSFSTFMLGLIAMTAAGIQAFPVVLLGVFAPLVVMPLLLKLTVYRNTRSVTLEDLPRFTPVQKGALPTIFGGAKEGAELLFLLIIPAVAVVYALIGALEYVGVWQVISEALKGVLTALSIDPETGIVAILASPTLAMGNLTKTAAQLDPRLVIGSFILASSGFPLSVLFGQIPAIWAGISDLSEREALEAAAVGIVLRIATAALMAVVLTPLVVR
ncbi:MAG: hypothetical protein AB1497_12045 [Bacillota bacterium]